ncbi:MAG: cupin domain-containing protein [Candidatus Omnitrophica bacterium]|nr:cupin domain-containing protein [Candidatus Omnitrophota bacterium]
MSISKKGCPFSGRPLVTQLKGRQKFLRLFGDSSKAKGLRSGFVVLKPKESVGLHNTGPSEEVIFIISGSGLVCHGKKDSVKIKKNSFVYIPPQIPHNVINTGKDLLRYIYTAARV